jgi:glycerol-3-phosphate acyltransferase PlsX
MVMLALDAMGSDHGPEVAVEGAAMISREPSGASIILIGDTAVLEPILARTAHDSSRIELRHAPSVAGMDESPKRALAEKPDCSVLVAARIVREGEADALVSAGNTGAVTLACSRTFERLDGVARCALGAVYPTERRRGEKDDPFSLILDVGLTLDVSAEDLVGFAVMGSAYASRIAKNPRPRVALLSNGSEPHKGTKQVVEAHARLAQLDCIDFIGNVEGTDIPRGTADVIVTGGFTGNIALKMLEGVADTMVRLGRYAMRKSLLYKAGFVLLSPAVKRLRQVTDWEQYGGAPILGFDRICIKAHGRSSSRAIANALKVANKAVRTDMVDAIRVGLSAAGLEGPRAVSTPPEPQEPRRTSP